MQTRVNLRPEGDERFIFIAGRHWIALALWLAPPLAVLLGAGVLLVARLLSRSSDVLGRQAAPFDAVNLVLLLMALAALAVALYVYFDWRNDHLILSNKRVVHEEITPWLSFRYEVIPLDQIQNVNVRIEHVLQYVLRYGRIEVQASGPTRPIVFKRAAQPGLIQQRIMDEVRREKSAQEQRRLREAVERRLRPTPPPPPPSPSLTRRSRRHPLLDTLLPLQPIEQNGTIIWHRHWIVLLRQLLWPTLALLGWLSALVAVVRFDLLAPLTASVVLGLALLAVLLFFFWQYEDWRNDIYILEPTRIIDISRLPFGLFEDRREATLGVIQNVNAASPNLVARLLGYGDVLIETAGQAGNFTFDHVPNPDDVQRIVFDYRERFRWQQREREWSNTLAMIDLYLQARDSGTTPQA